MANADRESRLFSVGGMTPRLQSATLPRPRRFGLIFVSSVPVAAAPLLAACLVPVAAMPLLASCRIEDQAELDRLVSEFAADAVDRRFGGGAFCRTAVDEIGGVGKPQVGELGNADAEKPVLGAVDFVGEQLDAGYEDAVGEAGRVDELAAPRPDAEIGRLQLERDCAA